jgi:hypothetical protein
VIILNCLYFNGDRIARNLCKKYFEGCYGVFIILGSISKSSMPLKEWTRAEIDLGKRCLEAAEVSDLPAGPWIKTI